MPKRAPSQDLAAETDCVSLKLHPRQTQRLIGQDEALHIAATAIRRGRPPSAWLLYGPPGVGKATLAYRIARYLLAYGATADGAEDLSVPPNMPAAIQVGEGAHPGLTVLKRGLNPSTGKPMSVLAVEEVRKLHAFFGMTAGAGGWRIALVDTADDLNDASANALLKLLEEPPARAMLLILAHAPGKVLPTIRSRCQRLRLRPLSDTDMASVTNGLLPDLSATEYAAVIRLAAGSPGAALRLAGDDGLFLAGEAEKLIDAAAAPDIPAIFALSDKIARMADGLPVLCDFLVLALSARIRDRALKGGENLSAWTEALDLMRRTAVRADALHLDPRETLLFMTGEIARGARRAGAL